MRQSGVLSAIMKAVRVQSFGGPEVCHAVSGIDLPNIGAGQVRINVEYAGVNPVDTYIRAGVYPIKPDLPYTPGQDCAGRVAEVGEGVSQFKVDDPVFTVRTVTGSYAEQTIALEKFVFPLRADKLSYEQGACMGVPFFSAYRAVVTKGQPKPGQRMLVHGGSGAVGTACIQIGKHLGLEVYTTASSEAGTKLVKACGADHVFNHRQEGYIQSMMETSGGAAFDIIIEMLANANLQHDLEMIKPAGRIVVVGSRGSVEVMPRFLMTKECIVTGIMLMSSTEEEWQEMRNASLEYQAQGVISPSVYKVYSLEEAADAQKEIIENSGSAGNIVLKAQS